MNGYTFGFSSLLLATIAFLVYAASLGIVAAMVTLAVLLTLALVAAGAGIALSATRIMSNQAQATFRDNTSENLGIMRELQGLQNQQNTQLLRQAAAVSRLPAAPVVGNPALLIEDGIFAELDN